MLKFSVLDKISMRIGDRRRCLAAAASLIACLALSACMSVSPRAVYELSKFDPFAADPRGIAVAIRTDRDLHLRTGEVVMRVSLASPDKALAFDETFLLAVTEGPGDPLFTVNVERNEHVIAAAFAGADIPRYEMVQKRVRAAKAAGKSKGNGTLSVAVKGGCSTGGPLGDGVKISTYMRTGSASGYFPLTGEMSLKSMVGTKSLKGIPQC